jgi:hypothetical protein
VKAKILITACEQRDECGFSTVETFGRAFSSSATAALTPSPPLKGRFVAVEDGAVAVVRAGGWIQVSCTDGPGR